MIRNMFLMVAIIIAAAVQPSQAAYVDEVLADGPVAYWRLNEKSEDANITDETGNVSAGSFQNIFGMEWGLPGAIVGDDNTAVRFQSENFGFGCGGACGSGDLDPGGVLDLGTIDSPQPITLEAWFKVYPTMEEALPGTSFPRIFHYNSFENGQYAFGLVGNESAGFPARTVWAGRGNGGDSGGVIISGDDGILDEYEGEVWLHLVALLQEDEVRLFLNGEELGDLFDSDPIAWQAEQATIGARIQNSGDLVQPFPGLIDELAIYDKLLSPERIQAHYRIGSGTGGVTGDFNGDGVLDAEDINDLTTQSASGTNPPTYDLNGDALVNEADVAVWIKDLYKSWVGDADLDRQFNSTDLVTVLASGLYEADADSVWTTGDFNGDGRSNSTDLVAALADGGYEAGPQAATAAVPEPSSVALLLLGWISISRLARRRN